MKSVLELIFKMLPLLVMGGIFYLLLGAKDNDIDEGLKLSLSALLGALASYLFIQYSEFIKRIESSKTRHYEALLSLEVKLNLQLNWLSDVLNHLKNHIAITKRTIDGDRRVTHDTSSYRDPISISQEIHDVTNVTLKNELISLTTSFDKIQNDVKTLVAGHKFGIEALLNERMPIEHYLLSLPKQVEDAKIIEKIASKSLVKNIRTIALIRVLAKNARSPYVKFRRFFVIQKDPPNLSDEIDSEFAELQREMDEVKSKSQAEIDEAKN